MAQSMELDMSEKEQTQLPTPPPEPASVDSAVEDSRVTRSSTETKDEQNTVEEQKTESTANTGNETTDKEVSSKDESSKSDNKGDEKTTEVTPSQSSDSEEESKDETSKSSDKKEDDKPATDKKEDDKADDTSKSKGKNKKKEKQERKKKEEEEKKKKMLPKGMKAELKTLFAKGNKSCRCCTTWVEEDPDKETSADETDECRQHAIVVRKKKKHEGNRKPLKVDSIVVHSPLLKKVLIKVFEGYPDLVIDVEELVLDAPFFPFFHRWSKFEEAKENEKDEVTKSHIVLLYDALAAELATTIQRHRDLIRHNAIDFDILWTLFAPGTMMFSVDNGHERLFKTGDCEYYQDVSGTQKFLLRCTMIDWNGEKFGSVLMSESITSFKGSKQIRTLPSYPLQFHSNPDAVLKKCIERGRKFKTLAGVHCKDFKGTAIEFAKFAHQTVQNKRHIEGRIMLDEEMFSKFNPDDCQDVRELQDEETTPTKSDDDQTKKDDGETDKSTDASPEKKEEEPAESSSSTSENSESNSDSQNNGMDAKEVLNTSDDSKPASITSQNLEAQAAAETVSGDVKDEGSVPVENKSKIEQAPAESDNKDSKVEAASKIPNTTPAEQNQEDEKTTSSDEQKLTDNQLAICNSWLRGYSLTHQKWASFSVENIEDVQWNNEAFKELTLPEEYRELILATIQSQILQNQIKQKQEQAEKEHKEFNSENSADFDDFIRGKGRGYIMLFSGNPGVGKTATAESIAELLHVPLCMISVGNLGTNAESVENALQDILEIAAKWNAVLLLDEADIFLEQRTKHDLHRNAVVSVFLRLLEYYQGVLCLTTNRAEEIDEAFHSRIHISLPFPDLTENSRESIWKQFARLTDKRAEKEFQQRKSRGSDVDVKDGQILPVKGELSGSTTPESKKAASTDNNLASNPACVNLSASDFRKLAQYPLNGRQIKNAFKTAVLLASYKKERVGIKHVKTALKTIEGRREKLGMYT